MNPNPYQSPREAPSTLRIVAGILLAVLMVGVLVVVGLWLAVEWIDPTYRGNGTPFPNP
jgi:uncharacterized membrane protein (DUF2068 family)